MGKKKSRSTQTSKGERNNVWKSNNKFMMKTKYIRECINIIKRNTHGLERCIYGRYVSR